MIGAARAPCVKNYEWLAILLALSHIVTIGLLVLWFSLNKPTTKAQFWSRFKRVYLSFSPPR